ncbi:MULTISPECIES: hypothetical protein [Neisseria]|uniref:hypothetical protein n=1 Tax=Neisseria TaxID=482 RepID=UPI0010718EF1|nr:MULTISPECIES: hypothetical protein [Neisseria]MBF0805041.1 hypothetical protein [Neisseria sp. 19428wB4_WF04]TFU39205.1 hypothetical protein E4T99_12325 [Neisseria sp. WF04]
MIADDATAFAVKDNGSIGLNTQDIGSPQHAMVSDTKYSIGFLWKLFFVTVAYFHVSRPVSTANLFQLLKLFPLFARHTLQ